jgi:biopolymer transport protein ExbD
MAVLELNLPTAESVVKQEEPEFSLEVIVRANQIEIGDRSAGVFSVIPKVKDRHDTQALTEKLKDVKASFPDQLAVTLLLESDTDYEVLVKVMDAVRSYRVNESGQFQRAELFPEISIGDAPLMAAVSD